MYEESDTFLLGPDAKIHFTDTHLTIPDGGLGQFCVEQMDDHAAAFSDDYGEYDEDDYHYDDQYPEYLQSHHGEHEHEHEHDGGPPQLGGCSPANDNADEYAERDDFYDCHDEANGGRAKPHEMVAFMCYRRAVYVRKCCGNGQNLNLRAGVCVDDGTRGEWHDPPVYVASEGGELVKSKAGNTILLDDTIRNMSGDNLHAPDQRFTLLLNQSLIVKGNFDYANGQIKTDWEYPISLEGKLYSKEDYCLDYLVDYCSFGGTASVELRVIIQDEGEQRAN